jgi:hypothetical protein
MWEWRLRSSISYLPTLDWDELWASCPGCFTPGEDPLGTQWRGGWVGPRGDLGALMKRKISGRCRELNGACPSRNLDFIPTQLFQLHHIYLWIYLFILLQFLFPRSPSVCSPVALLSAGAVELRTPMTLLTARTALMNGWTNVLVGKPTPDLQCNFPDASWELVSDNEK